MSKLIELQKALQQLTDTKQKAILQRFFKTGIGEYGEGDIFLGIKVPIQRKLAQKYQTLSLTDIQTLLQSEIHEYRCTALILLTARYFKSSELEKKVVFEFYLHHTQYINNWDLVDLSAPKIVGDYLLDKPRDILYELAYSTSVWERRIAIIATMIFVKHNDFNDTLKLAHILLNDTHDLIHKAVGWMLREVGKRDQKQEECFLKKHYKKMPRTMLRYAIEKFDAQKRQFYLNKK
jgi:3-methyladenine DNA glycosylase AlkD